MHPLLFAALAAPALATPTSPRAGVQPLSVPMARYRPAAHNDLQKRADTHTLDLQTLKGSGYFYVNVTVGTPPVEVSMEISQWYSKIAIIDVATGKAAYDAQNIAFPWGEQAYFPEKSSTYKTDGKNESTSYGGCFQQKNTVIGTDTFVIAGETFKDQEFAYVGETVCSYFTLAAQYGLAGVIGLDYPYMNLDNTTQWWKPWADQWPSPEYGVYIVPQTDEMPSADALQAWVKGGEITFGGTNATYYDGEIDYMTCAHNNWTLPLEDIQMGGKSIGALPNGSIAQFALDTNFIAVPNSLVEAVNTLIPGAARYQGMGNASDVFQVPCNTTQNVSFTIGGRSYVLEPKDYVAFGADNADLCISMLVPSGQDDSMFYLGSPFLSTVYTSFKVTDPPQIGFATIKKEYGGTGVPAPVVGNRSSTGNLTGNSTGSAKDDKDAKSGAPQVGVPFAAVAGLAAMALALVL